jgi:hypothetical protein
VLATTAPGQPPGNPTSCGGRAPTYDVIDMSYTVLAAGIGPALSTTTWVSDGVTTGGANNDTFPFLATPN